jgi:thiol-disulfide isomerase/thioredoxin
MAPQTACARPWMRVAAVCSVVACLALGGVARLAAEDVHLTGMEGEQLNDAELAKGTTIVIVWACWSPRSRDIATRVKPLADHWGGRARVLALDFEEDRPTVKAFLGGKSMGVPIFLDSDGLFSKKYAIATLPGLLVIREGKVEYHGKLPDDPDRVLTDILH